MDGGISQSAPGSRLFNQSWIKNNNFMFEKVLKTPVDTCEFRRKIERIEHDFGYPIGHKGVTQCNRLEIETFLGRATGPSQGSMNQISLNNISSSHLCVTNLLQF